MTAAILLLALAASTMPALPAASSGNGERPPYKDGAPLRTAGGVVRSREWLIRRAPQREEEFIGEVSYRQGPSLLSSDWALLRHDSQTWQARGRVRLVHTLKSGDRIEVWGGNALYEQKSDRGRLLGAGGGAIGFTRFPAEGPADQGTALRLDWEGRQRARLSGGVHVKGPRLDLRGAEADYDAGRGTLTVSGERPVLRLLEGDWTGAVQGDTLVARQKPDRLWADGKAQGWIRFKEKLEKLAQ